MPYFREISPNEKRSTEGKTVRGSEAEEYKEPQRIIIPKHNYTELRKITP